MDVLKTVVNYVLDLGAPVFVPLIMFILATCAGLKLKKSVLAALTLGVAFSGMTLVVNYMMDSISPAAKAMSKIFHLSLNAIDAGWTGVAAITWSYKSAFLFFPLLLAINFIMLTFNWTKTLNVDMWNVWNKIFTYVVVLYFTHNAFFGFIVAGIQIVLELKAGDMWQRHIEDLTGMPGVTVPHFVTLFAVILQPLNKLLDFIPIMNKPFDSAALQKKIGIFGDNTVMGAIIGVLLGFGAGYSVSKSLNLAIQAATAMTLFPMISKLFMQALSPIADAMSNFMKKHFNGRQVFIGVDWPILAGRNELWVTVIILVPVMLIFAMILPGNTVLPFAGIINLSFVVAALLLTGANLLRMLVLGLITTPIFLYGATYFAPIITNLAKTTGTVKVHAGQQLSWSTFEGPDFRLFFAKAFAGEWWAIGLSVLWLLGFVWLYIDQNKIKLPSQRYATVKNASVTKNSNTNSSIFSKNTSNTGLDDLNGMDFGGASKTTTAVSNDDISLDDLDGMDFGNSNKKK
ncbi:PTS galactitol transporter subunit IIC [Companilactobacillus paralimentarius]|uniref:Galactitol permease IIC component n=2 Tax=Companilactobacillus kimchii TaxID=2801452 RepID=A0A210PCY5_9LACO|nr:PTS transporter subunit IIC [Companilactobacillus kimchii]KAE9562163.1 PTS galactitol transporter subunit IIC [Companilactobacillus kimchii]OWF34301.1 Galactitol permease IIC component [Companilactobacillus kimchii]GEO46222.1 PTS galactitol transporter subunit IIC [Companilactobacillus paralimentarius]